MTKQSPRKPGRSAFEGVSEGRRRNMQANRSKGTGPEMEVRRLLHALGYRFRLHRRGLPGKPDLVFSARRAVVEVRGCFWHGHGCNSIGQLPKSRIDYWGPKIAKNKERDARNLSELREQGWHILEVWECRLRGAREEITMELIEFLGPAKALG